IKRRRGMRSQRRGFTWLAVMALVLILGAVATAQEKQWWPFPVEDRDPPFDMEGKKIKNQYTPLPHAAKKWNICVSFPHMKDAYWTAVEDRKSTRLNSSHVSTSYAVFCLKKKNIDLKLPTNSLIRSHHNAFSPFDASCGHPAPSMYPDPRSASAIRDGGQFTC